MQTQEHSGANEGNYKYGILDPRSNPKLQAQIDENNAKLLGGRTLGIEVTVPKLAEQCVLGNVDPQHSGSKAPHAAIEDCINLTLPPVGSTLVTVRADLDSVGAMALLELRAAAGAIANLNEEVRIPIEERIAMIAKADSHNYGSWPGPKELPTEVNPWPERAVTPESKDLAPLAAAVADFKLPIESRVQVMKDWLLTGQIPSEYIHKIENERAELIQALKAGQIKYSTLGNGRVAIVESTHKAAMLIGYSLAPVVIAVNPSFKQGSEEPYLKYTVAQHNEGFLEMHALLADLRTKEPGWGGSANIVGSTQGASSSYKIEDLIAAVSLRLQGPTQHVVLDNTWKLTTEPFPAFRAELVYGRNKRDREFLPVKDLQLRPDYTVTTNYGKELLYRGDDKILAEQIRALHNEKPGNAVYGKNAELKEGPLLLPAGKFNVIKTKEKGTILIVPGQDNTNRCLLFVGCEGGFRGGVSVVTEGTTGAVLKECSAGNACESSCHVIVLMKAGETIAFHSYGRSTNEVQLYTWTGAEVQKKSYSISEWRDRAQITNGNDGTPL